MIKITMKKVAALLAPIAYLLSSARAFAQDIVIQPPREGYRDIGKFITNILQLAFILAVIAVLAMMIWGAFEWIISGGDKEAVGKARGKILNALIGLAILAVAYAVFKLAGSFLGFTNVETFTIPRPQ